MRTIFKLTVFCALAIMVQACRTITPTTNISYVSQREGTITVRSTGVGITHEKAKADAEKNAFNALFFRGFPESSQKIPLIGYDETGITKQYGSYFDQLYGNRRYWSFVQQSQPVGKFQKRRLTVEITIHLRALRADLEDEGIIRKFGY